MVEDRRKRRQGVEAPHGLFAVALALKDSWTHGYSIGRKGAVVETYSAEISRRIG
jgi:hypothetical protein